MKRCVRQSARRLDTGPELEKYLATFSKQTSMQPLGVHEQSQRKLGNPVVGVERVSPISQAGALGT